MKVLVTGSTGLVGRGALQAALVHPEVTSVLSITRSSVGFTHPKLEEILHGDFTNLEPVESAFESLDACFWCLGISAVGLSESAYRTITVDYTLEAARRFSAQAPSLHFCFVSGAGADDSERSRAMWARVKGHAENALRAAATGPVTVFRPAFIRATDRPARGFGERLSEGAKAVFEPALRLGGASTTNVEIGEAMIGAARGDAPSGLLDTDAINALARRVRSAVDASVVPRGH